ncbi:MerR family transcriptional regulator [Brachybacterium sp. DNPG3]
MQLSDLSETSGVSIASIKYYRREGLLPAGIRVTATRQEYDQRHIDRLRLIQVLRDAADAPIQRIARLTAILDDPARPLLDAIGDAHAIALGIEDDGHPSAPTAAPAAASPMGGASTSGDEDEERDDGDESEAGEHPLIAPLLERLGWPDIDTAPRRALDSTLRLLESWNLEHIEEELERYAQPMADIARGDLEQLRRMPVGLENALGEGGAAGAGDAAGEGGASMPSDDAVVLRVVAGTIGFDRLLRALRFLGHASLVHTTFNDVEGFRSPRP